jgi:hypothetical protein
MDSLYLATALEYVEQGLDVALLSFDARQREAALDLGVAVIPATLPGPADLSGPLTPR